MSNDKTGFWLQAMRKVLAAETDDFVELLQLTGLDPKRHLRLSDWSGIDFSGADLRGFDFTGANLVGCSFQDALIEGARFDEAEIDQAHFDRGKRTNLRRAKDWDRFVATWKRADTLPSGSHLSVSAVFQDAPFAPEMVVVPGGWFLMGETPEDQQRFSADQTEIRGMPPLHVADGTDQQAIGGIPPFAVSRFVVTREEWKWFIRDGGRDKFADQDGARGRWKAGAKSADETRGKWADEDLEPRDMPATRMTWHDAKAYVAWLSAKTGESYRLLDLVEWEYVARAGTTTTYWWGDEITPGLANYDPAYRDLRTVSEEELTAFINRGSTRSVMPVDRYAPNPWGLYQVHGNVWEWCEGWQIPKEQTRDKDNPDFSIDPAMMLAPLRGGAFYSSAAHCRAAALSVQLGLGTNEVSGFRVARDLLR
jgi:formylglycine-generating enzyme required for sulfatase activity